MEEKMPWHECTKCGSIFDADTFACPPCAAEDPRLLRLTRKEILERVWPNIQKIWTKQPMSFSAPLLEVRQEYGIS